MLMVIDIGNTTIHGGIYSADSDSVSDNFIINHRETDFTQIKKVIVEHLKIFSVEKIALCSVFKNFEHKLAAGLNDYNVFAVRSDLDIGVKLNYFPVESLGADRFANIAAFTRRYNLPGAVIDIGSALTIDIIDEKNNYKGGLIFPGPGMCRDSVSEKTDLLPRVEIKQSPKMMGNSTNESIQIGIYTGFKCMITELICRIQKEFQNGCFITVATGGWCSLWENDLPCVNIVDRNFTMKGIADIYYMFN